MVNNQSNLPSSFLEKTARHLISNYGTELSEICVILPNRRAGLFLRKFLAAGLSKPVWSPAIYSIEDFMASLSGLKETEPVHLLLDLYSVHRDLNKEKPQSFDEFLKWGPQLLSDFNDIDRYLADAGALFGFLDEARAINLWNLDKSPLTEFQQNYLRFYHSLSSYYSMLTHRLLERGEGYQGLIFRQAFLRLEKGESVLPLKMYLFAGFNVLTKAEEKTMEYLFRAGRADFLWDADHFYLDNPVREAGTYLRQWFSKDRAAEKKWISDDYREGAKEIEIIGIPDVAGQVKYCGELLQKMTDKPDERTAIVLPDEQLLIPLLNSLPDSIDSLNITMGLPLKQTPVADLLDLVFQMHLHTSGMKGGKPIAKHFYFRDVIKILQHPLLVRIAEPAWAGSGLTLSDMVNRIRAGTRVFVGKDDLVENDLFTPGFDFLNPFFESWNVPIDAIRGLRQIAGLIRDTEPEYAFVFARLLNQLDQVLFANPDYFTWQTVYQLYRQMVVSSSMPFYGEPLSGLQVMGMLETRSLDFDQIIILSCNEGILPAGKTTHSFIPFDIKREFGLPDYQQKDAVYAYHFYRLIQRARKVWLLYNTEPDLLGSGEKSRFIHQILNELPDWNPKITIRERYLITPLPGVLTNTPISIEKTEEIRGKLLQKALDGYSPTALNAYRKCSLRFYFSEIAQLREPDEVEDTIDPRTLGNAVHESLNKLYQSVKGIPLNKGLIQSMISGIDQVVDKAFQEKFKGSAITYGKNLLLVNVAKIMIRNFLKTEIQSVEELQQNGKTITVVVLEHRLYRAVQIPSEGKLLDVTLKGFVDRVDRVDGEIWVIDYKTGYTEKNELRINDWNALYHDPKLDKGFQLLYYSLLVPFVLKGVRTRAGIVSMKKTGNGFMTVQIPVGETMLADHEGISLSERKDPVRVTDKITETDLEKFEIVICDLLSEIYDMNTRFEQTGNAEVCILCPYKMLCQR